MAAFGRASGMRISTGENISTGKKIPLRLGAKVCRRSLPGAIRRTWGGKGGIAFRQTRPGS
ncbi:MAG: hypothetical protein DBX55_00470 [Verrucomicrobia bacterium]|nr:MAG: hypothetical protein DBX55_00470 [Verrucomicrobiota bacterium]